MLGVATLAFELAIRARLTLTVLGADRIWRVAQWAGDPLGSRRDSSATGSKIIAGSAPPEAAAQLGFRSICARSTHQLSAGQALVMVRISEGLLGRPVPSGLLPS